MFVSLFMQSNVNSNLHVSILDIMDNKSISRVDIEVYIRANILGLGGVLKHEKDGHQRVIANCLGLRWYCNRSRMDTLECMPIDWDWELYCNRIGMYIRK